MPSRRTIFCSGEHTSICHLDISTINESLTAEDGQTNTNAQQIAHHVWKRLIKEYLPTLLPRQKWLKRTAPVLVGQTVWILKDFTPRGLWPIGRISAIDNDTQQPRQNEVKTKTGTFTIPAIRLALIEAEECLHHDDSDEDEEEEEEAKIITF